MASIVTLKSRATKTNGKQLPPRAIDFVDNSVGKQQANPLGNGHDGPSERVQAAD